MSPIAVSGVSGAMAERSASASCTVATSSATTGTAAGAWSPPSARQLPRRHRTEIHGIDLLPVAIEGRLPLLGRERASAPSVDGEVLLVLMPDHVLVLEPHERMERERADCAPTFCRSLVDSDTKRLEVARVAHAPELDQLTLVVSERRPREVAVCDEAGVDCFRPSTRVPEDVLVGTGVGVKRAQWAARVSNGRLCCHAQRTSRVPSPLLLNQEKRL
jgi:hypothetical protein